MPYKLAIKEAARMDMSESYWYYEEQQAGLGERLLSEVQKRLNDLSIHPEYYSYIDNKQVLRDITLNNFPYVLIYRIIKGEVSVYAVLHTRKGSKAPSE
jgi:plasmid stabilization system protein ParE